MTYLQYIFRSIIEFRLVISPCEERISVIANQHIYIDILHILNIMQLKLVRLKRERSSVLSTTVYMAALRLREKGFIIG